MMISLLYWVFDIQKGTLALVFFSLTHDLIDTDRYFNVYYLHFSLYLYFCHRLLGVCPAPTSECREPRNNPVAKIRNATQPHAIDFAGS